MGENLSKSLNLQTLGQDLRLNKGASLGALSLTRRLLPYDTATTLRSADDSINQKLVQQSTWRRELSEELKYWRMWFETKGDEWPDDYEKRFNSASEFDQNLRRYIEPSIDDEINFLDVGSGPVTGVGFVWPGRKLRITAVDPLADHYNRIMDELSIQPPVRSQSCPAELLLAKFPDERFDLVHCRNALDHSYAPLAAIKQMLAVTKSGGAVILDHYANEALHHSYTGLHQWNFDIQDNRFILWNRNSKIDVAQALQESAGSAIAIECRERPQGRKWVMAIIRRDSKN
jgi:SAM-dependent methyltransferase